MSDGEPDREWTPMADRRRFIAAVGAAGAAGLAGCVFGGGGSDGGDGGDGSDGSDGSDGDGGGSGGDGSDGDGGGSGGDGSDGDGSDTTRSDDGEGGVDTVPPGENPAMPAERRDFLVPAGEADTTFDATLSEDTVYVGGDTIEAVVDADTESHEYVLDESMLGREVAEGDVLLISGVSLRRVTGIDRSGSEATVQTEAASLNEAISEGTVGWDAEIGFDFEHAGASDARTDASGSLVDSRSGDRPGSLDGGAGGHPTDGTDRIYFAGVEMTGADGHTELIPPSEMDLTGPTLEWSFSQGELDYIFELDKSSDEVTVSVTVQKVVGGNASLAFVGEGTVGRARSVASAEYSDGELSELDLRHDDIGGEITLSVEAAGSGEGTIDWEFPGAMFKFVVPAGPVPVTVGYAPKLIGQYTVPVRGSASAEATFGFNTSVGFQYAGTSTDVDATVGEDRIDPEPADSAANMGNAVDAQFGFAFPRLTVSIFEQGIIPFIHAGTTIGSRLTWGPLCKSSYVRFVVQAGYDLEVLGVSFASEKDTLYENVERAEGDSCESG